MSTPKTIIQKLRRLNAKVELELAQAGLAALDNPDIPVTSAFAEELSTLAVQAVIGGSGSQAWKDYMKLIVGTNNPQASAQFKRLTFQDNQADQQFVRKSAAYIVANAVCGEHTTTRTLANVETEGTDTIDINLPPEL
jgi:hypothetical protein